MTVAPVVVGVDGSEESRLALRWAFEYGQMSGAPVEAVIAWRIPPPYGWPVSYDDVDLEKQAQQTLGETIRDVLGDNAAVTRRVERGHPAVTLVAASERAQLLVIGSRVTGRLRGCCLARSASTASTTRSARSSSSAGARTGHGPRADQAAKRLHQPQPPIKPRSVIAVPKSDRLEVESPGHFIPSAWGFGRRMVSTPVIRNIHERPSPDVPGATR